MPDVQKFLKETPVKIAVVIPIKNEKEGLLELVGLLLRQSLPPDEIIFVDAGSTDGSLGIVKRLSGENSRIKLLVVSGASPGKGRNAGIKSTDADIVAQIDGGNLPADDMWLEKLCAPILAGKADYVVGNIRFMPVMKKILGVRFDIGDVYGACLHTNFRPVRDETTIDGGASVAYLRKVWEKAGGFPEFCKTGEDGLFATKVSNLKTSITFVCDASIYWQIGPRLSDIVGRQVRYQRAKFRQSKHVLKFKGTVLLPFLALATAIVSFFTGYVWLVLLATVLLYWLKRCQKVFRVYLIFTRQKITGWKCFVALGAIVGIELIHIFSRIIGTVSGILEIRENRRFRERMNNYLHGTSHQ